MCDLCIKETNLHKNSKTIEYYIDSDGCWICTSHPKDHGGYCHIVRNRKVSLAHRYVYELLIKKIKEGLHLLHHCDKRACINPSCMFEGTDLDNNRDMRRKGRAVYVRGERQGLSKLKETDVKNIRSLYDTGDYSHLDLAIIFGVNKSTIGRIIRYNTWKETT